MENATKALIIAAGVFIGIMILTLGAYLYTSLNSYVVENNKIMEENALSKFNTQFLNYINYNNDENRKFELQIQDIVTVANIAYENNRYYEFDFAEDYDDTTLYVTVNVDKVKFLSGTERRTNNLEKIINTKSSEILSNNIGCKYKCTPNDVKVSEKTGRVYQINFTKISD